MAEDLFGGVLGEENEKPDIEAPGALPGAEAFAAAVAARLSSSDPDVARDTSTFLKKQAQLLEIQADHLKDEHALRLTQLRHQSHLLRGQRLGQAIRITFQIAIALIAIIVAIGIGVMIHDAFNSRNVVVEPFDTPPVLAAGGVTGKVVASGLLDELTRLQNATRSSRQKRDLSNAWANEVTLSVPETGLSLGEISHVLTARFGHDVIIDGDLTETSAGALTLTIRGSHVTPKSFSGTSTELSMLLNEAAEYVYAQSEPAQWSTYLVNTGRFAEAIAFCKWTYASADPADRVELLANWGSALGSSGGSLREVLALDREAIKLDPDNWGGYNNIAADLASLGDEEGAWRSGQALRAQAGGRPGRAPESAWATQDLLTWNLSALLEYRRADAESHGGGGTFLSSSGSILAFLEARLHDPASAELSLQTIPSDPKDVLGSATIHFVRALLATEAGDVARAAAEMEAFAVAYTNPAVAFDRAGTTCWIAPAEEAAGHPEKADAALKLAGTYVDCYRFRGDILDGRRDWAAAQEAYADAVALAPDLPAGYYSWGVALAKHGDLSGAEAKLKDSNQRGPHWADPLKAWGDVLVKQGNTREALAKYDEALKYAPNWKQLKESREVAAKQKS